MARTRRHIRYRHRRLLMIVVRDERTVNPTLATQTPYVWDVRSPLRIGDSTKRWPGVDGMRATGWVQRSVHPQESLTRPKQLRPTAKGGSLVIPPFRACIFTRPPRPGSPLGDSGRPTRPFPHMRGHTPIRGRAARTFRTTRQLSTMQILEFLFIVVA